MLFKLVSLVSFILATTTMTSVRGSPIPTDANYSIVEPSENHELDKGYPQKASQGIAPTSNSLPCTGPSYYDNSYTYLCSGSAWYHWVDCNDGVRYVSPRIGGTRKSTIQCPTGFQPKGTGVYGS
ncbi:hypothetical protein BGZ76_003624 [Entomortierella beljakovae]|nr:hypothetical protein BGZ76_003624 [Entomortierella beljakovae]